MLEASKGKKILEIKLPYIEKEMVAPINDEKFRENMLSSWHWNKNTIIYLGNKQIINSIPSNLSDDLNLCEPSVQVKQVRLWYHSVDKSRS